MSDATRGSLLNRPVQRRSVPVWPVARFLLRQVTIEGSAEMTSSPCQAAQVVATTSIGSAKGGREAAYFQFRAVVNNQLHPTVPAPTLLRRI